MHLIDIASISKANADRAIEKMNRAAAEITEREIERQAAAYVRERDLLKLIGGFDRDELATAHPAAAILALQLAFRAEQQRARKGHWASHGMSYVRMVAFKAAILAEERDLAAIQRDEIARNAEIARRFPDPATYPPEIIKWAEEELAADGIRHYCGTRNEDCACHRMQGEAAE